MAQGPRALAFRAQGLGDQATSFLKNNFGFALFSGKGFVFCAGVLSDVRGSCLLCRGLVLCAGVKSYVQGSSLMCRGQVLCAGAKSYVQGQTLVTLFFYGVNALGRERSMT